MEAPDDTEVEVEFVSNYAEEDINDSLKEIFDEKLVPSLPTLVSRERVTQRSADHVCKVKLNIQGDKKRCLQGCEVAKGCLPFHILEVCIPKIHGCIFFKSFI